MTIKELIEKLKELPGGLENELEIWCHNDCGDRVRMGSVCIQDDYDYKEKKETLIVFFGF